MTPYYQDDAVTIYHGDCRNLIDGLEFDVIVTDPPYPNNAGHFTDAVEHAEITCRSIAVPAIVFWSELESPPVPLPLTAVHIWHRSNVNGRPYEPAYEFNPDGRKRRSQVLRHPAIFDGAGPGCHEYLGHPTQKPVALMRVLLGQSVGVVLDPYCGSGSTLRAAKDLSRRAVGIEIDEAYCEIAARRCAQEVLAL